MFSDECMNPLSWETRNLGIECFGLKESFIENPDGELLKQCLHDKRSLVEKFFVQARVAKQHVITSKLLEKQGFYFVEAVLCPFTVISKNKAFENFLADKSAFLPKRFRIEEVGMLTLSNPDGQVLGDIMSIASESFTDDRFHVDPYCAPEIANGRYSYWADDLAQDETVKFNLLTYQQKTIAFMARRSDNLLLAGFSQKHIGSGMGDFFWLSVLENMLGEGLHSASTLISVHNIPVLNLYARIGFKFKNPSATFHYWSE